MTARCRRAWTLAPVVLAGVLIAPAAALAQYVDLPGTQPGDLAADTPLDSARSCGTTCHFSRDATMPSAMPYDGYVGSMMGNTMRDPLYLAALTVAEQDHPGVGDYCLRCHTPPGFVAGHTRGTPTAPLGTDLVTEDRDGVSCDSCHRMTETANLGNAQYVISPTDTRFGPYPVIDSIRHPGAQSTWLADARMCGTCHEITNPAQPLRRADGTDTGQRFPLDTTYAEWANSAFAVAGSPDARTCQDCHLPRTGMPGFVATNTTAMMRDNPRRHDFAGANAWAIRVLGAMRSDVSTGEFYDPDSAPFYEAAAVRAEASLRSAVTLELREVPATAAAGSRIEVVARITNRAGHRVPSGYADGRRVWLELALLDGAGHTTVVSGNYDTTEAHLDTTDTQLKVYETVQGRVGVGPEDHIALHDTIIRDSRLPPRGYRPLPGHEPVGVDYSGGDGGALRHWDDTRYAFTVPATAAAGSALTVRVRARYQSTTREYVEFLARENHTDGRGMELLRRYEASGRAAPYNMAEATAQVMVTMAPPPDGGPGDGGDDASAAADAGADAGDGAARDEGTTPPRGTCGCRTVGSGGGDHGAPGPRRGTLLAVSIALAVAAARVRRRGVR